MKRPLNDERVSSNANLVFEGGASGGKGDFPPCMPDGILPYAKSSFVGVAVF